LGAPLDPAYDSLCSPRWRLLGDTARACVASKLPKSNTKKRVGRTADDAGQSRARAKELSLVSDVYHAEYPTGEAVQHGLVFKHRRPENLALLVEARHVDVELHRGVVAREGAHELQALRNETDGRGRRGPLPSGAAAELERQALRELVDRLFGHDGQKWRQPGGDLP